MTALSDTGNKIKILHVTECYGGGVGTAIDKIVEIYEDADHYLLWTGDQNPALNSRIAGHRKFPEGLAGRVRAVKQYVAELSVDVVHAHSSWAGVYTRILKLKTPVIYQPHCFVFDDPNRASPIRTVYKLIESLLSRRSGVTFVLSDHERDLARSINSGQRLLFLPNVPTVPVTEHQQNNRSVGRSVLMSGRIALQKDPAFFASVAEQCRQISPELRFVWIGDGEDQSLRALLESAGVEITGWLDKKQLLARLDGNNIYLHSAQYEGFPLSVLDSLARDLPAVVRPLPCFDGTGLFTTATVEEATQSVLRAISEPDFADNLRERGAQLLTRMNETQQIESLRSGYNSVISESPITV